MTILTDYAVTPVLVCFVVRGDPPPANDHESELVHLVLSRPSHASATARPLQGSGQKVTACKLGSEKRRYEGYDQDYSQSIIRKVPVPGPLEDHRYHPK